MITKEMITEKLSVSRRKLAELQKKIPQEVSTQREFMRGMEMTIEAEGFRGAIVALEWMYGELTQNREVSHHEK